MKRSTRGTWVALAQALVLGCAGGDAYEPLEEEGPEIGTTLEAVAACEGDDLQYDFNAFAASLAVASATELGRWDALADYQIASGQLRLSPTGEIRCEGWRGDSPGGCENIRAILALQSDASASVPFHSPALFRSKLTGWYQRQATELTNQLGAKLRVDKGVYRIRSRATSQYLSVAADGLVTQAAPSSSASSTGADEWRVTLQGTTHQLVNVQSGQCLDLESIWSARLVQRACSPSRTQDFFTAELSAPYFALRSGDGRAMLAAASGSGVALGMFSASSTDSQWAFEPVGSEHVDLDAVAEGVYALMIRHSGRALGVDGGQMRDGALLEQRNYEAWDDRYNWYVSRTGTGYELINRRSGKCIDLEVPGSSASRLVQRACSGVASQRFSFQPTGDGYQMLITAQGRAVEVAGASTSSDANLTQGSTAWAAHRQFALRPIAAGEPHVLTFSHVTQDGPCGDYHWYTITQPNGAPLHEPQDSFVQLIFAGGKVTPEGEDENPFIAQLVTGTQVAIDPAAYMNAGSRRSSGSCIASDLLYSAQNAAGTCCLRYDGRPGTFVRSSWNPTTYLCR